MKPWFPIVIKYACEYIHKNLTELCNKSFNTFLKIRKYAIIKSKSFSKVNILRHKASRNQAALIATILQMRPLSSSALTTPFVFAEGGQLFNPMGRIIASLACSPSTPLPATALASHKIPHFNCVPWKPVGEEEEKRQGRREKKELNSGEPVFIPGPMHCKQQTVNHSRGRKRHNGQKQWRTGPPVSNSVGPGFFNNWSSSQLNPAHW